MKSARQLSNDIIVERHAQRGLLKFANGITKTHIAKLNGIPVTYTVFDKEGNTIELNISKINKKALDKYIKQRHEPLELGVITGNFVPIVIDITRWLLRGGYSEQYTYARSVAARRFIRDAVVLLLAPYFLKHLHENHEFIDTWAECQFSNILIAQAFAEETHKATGHAKKHDEDLTEAQEAIYQRYITILDNRKFVPYEPLPELPAGTIDPLTMPDEEEDEESE